MSKRYVVFQVSEGQYAVPIKDISQIVRYENVTEVPTAPPFVDGVINVGGEVIPVVNLRSRFSLPGIEIARKNRVIIVRKEERSFGLLVDEVREMVDLDEDSIAPEAASVFGMKPDFVLGIARIGESLLVLLDVFKVLATSAEVSAKE